MAQQITASQMRALVGQDVKAKVASIMRSPSMGAALYTDNQGNSMLMSYGTWEAELPQRFPAGSVGDLQLSCYVAPGATGAAEGQMMSPLKAALLNAMDEHPQEPSRFAPPGQIRTEHPGEHGRTYPMSVPAEVPPDRAQILQERAPAPPKPPADPEAVAAADWWDRNLGPRR